MYDVFSLPETRFPEGFLWGSATAGHQIEGDNIHSQLWRDEQEGKFDVPSGKACNHYALYRQDVELLAELEHKGYRMSVEWSRIEPEEGKWDEAAEAHYVDLLERLKSKGIKVFVTLLHWAHPLWFEEKGGFKKAENIRFFERFAEHIAARIAPCVDGWIVINEFNLRRAADSGPEKFIMLRAHARGYHAIKQHSKAPVGTAHAFVHWFPRRRYDQFDNVMTAYLDLITHEFFFHAIRTGELVHPYTKAEYDPLVKGTSDYWAVNYYTRHMVDAREPSLEGARFAHKKLRLIDQDFYFEEFFPEGLTSNLEKLKDRPVYITENGCCCTDDRFRIAYIALQLSALKEAMERGVDVKGYFYWSLMDNYEWGSFLPRFGLVDVDFKTFRRTPKPSAFFYRDVIRHNGLSPEIIARHLKELPTLSSPDARQG